MIQTYGQGAVALDLACAREVARAIMLESTVRRVPNHSLIPILLISGADAVVDETGEWAGAELRMLLLLSPLPLARPVFAAAVSFRPRMMKLADNPLDVCDTVSADGLGARLLVPQQPVRDIRVVNLRLKTLSSGMKRVARDGRALRLRWLVQVAASSTRAVAGGAACGRGPGRARNRPG